MCILSPKKISIVSKSPNSESPPKIKWQKKDNQRNWGEGDQAKYKVMGSQREHGGVGIV